MASYIVMEPPLAAADDRAAGARVIRDGFAVFAFVLPLFWFLFHRMWIEAAVVLVLIFTIGFLDDWLGLAGMATAITLLLSLIAGLEGPNLRQAALARRGWRPWGVVEARRRDEAELRYLTEVDLDPPATPASDAVPVPDAMPSATVRPRRAHGHAALGMFDYPGGR